MRFECDNPRKRQKQEIVRFFLWLAALLLGSILAKYAPTPSNFQPGLSGALTGLGMSMFLFGIAVLGIWLLDGRRYVFSNKPNL